MPTSGTVLARLAGSVGSKSAAGDDAAIRRIRAAKAAEYVRVAIGDLAAAAADVPDHPRPATLAAAVALADDLADLIGDLTAPPTLTEGKHAQLLAVLAADAPAVVA